MPISNRNIVDMINLTPGVGHVSQGNNVNRNQQRLNIEGNRSYSTNVQLDGGSMYFAHRGQGIELQPKTPPAQAADDPGCGEHDRHKFQRRDRPVFDRAEGQRTEDQQGHQHEPGGAIARGFTGPLMAVASADAGRFFRDGDRFQVFRFCCHDSLIGRYFE